MTRLSLFLMTAAAGLTLAAHSLAQDAAHESHQHTAHEGHQHTGYDDYAHDHHAPDNASHDHKSKDHQHSGERGLSSPVKSLDPSLDTVALTRSAEITAALDAGGSPVVVKVLGVVCDFCAKAMDKTFGKRAEVAAVYVDLDTKTLNLVLKSGQMIDDEMIGKLVKKAGYKVDRIYRGEAIAINPTAQADPS